MGAALRQDALLQDTSEFIRSRAGKVLYLLQTLQPKSSGSGISGPSFLWRSPTTQWLGPAFLDAFGAIDVDTLLLE